MKNIGRESLAGFYLASALTFGAISFNGCQSYMPPRVGGKNIVAGSVEHIDLLLDESEERGIYFRDEKAIIDSFIDGEERSLRLEDRFAGRESTIIGFGNVLFETRRLESGSFYVSWTKEKNERSAVMCNGLGTSCLDVSEMGRRMSMDGINFYAIDRTASGINVEFRANERRWISDIEEVVKIAYMELDEKSRPVIIGQCFSTGLVAKTVRRNPEIFSGAIYLTPAVKLNYDISVPEKIEIGIGRVFGFDCPHKNPVPIDAYISSEGGKEYLRRDPLFSYMPSCATMVFGNNLNKRALRNIEDSDIESVAILASDDKVVNNWGTFNALKKRGIDRIRVVNSDHYLPLSEEGVDTVRKEVYYLTLDFEGEVGK